MTNTIDLRKFNKDEKGLMFHLVNRYGDSGVIMRNENGKFFKVPFVRNVVKKSMTKLTGPGIEVAKQILKKLK